MSDESTTVNSDTEERDAGSTRSSAEDLGDITAFRLPDGLQRLVQTVGFDGDAVNYYRFELSESREVRMALTPRSGQVEMYLEDAAGNVLSRSMAFASYELVVRTLSAGTYYLRVLPVGSGSSEYEFKYGVLASDTAWRPWGLEPGLAERLGTPSFAEASHAFELAENADGGETGISLGTVSATDPSGEVLSYHIVGGNELGLFAIDASSGGLFYVGSGEDYESGAGSYQLTVRASDGTHTVDAAVTVTITNVPEAPSFGSSSYAFDLAENVDGTATRVSLGTATATDADGDDTLRYSLVGGNESGRFSIDAASGEVFYAGPGEDFESGAGSYELTIRASDGTHMVDATVAVTITNVPETPSFSSSSYAFTLAENADGSEAGISLGTVSAAGPDSDTVRYSLVAGNESRLFAIDAASGEVFYVGTGEDFESGAGSYELTIRASDGTHMVDATVAVTITNVPEAPKFAKSSYAFALAENADGSEAGISLGTVSAADPDGDTVRYSLVAGNESRLFAIDAASGEVFYVATGEDFESGAGPYELTVRASDGTQVVDAAITVAVTDEVEAASPQGSSEPPGEDLPAERSTSGEVGVDAEPVEGTLGSPSDRDWFTVTLAPGRTYVFTLEGDVPSGAPVPEIRGLRDSEGNRVPGIARGAEVRYTTASSGVEAVYYVEVGGADSPGRGLATSRGLGTLSLSVIPLDSNSEGGISGYQLRANDITETRNVTDDHSSSLSPGAGVVAVGDSVGGEIERSGDRDWFAVDLLADRLYRIELKGLSTGDGTLPDPFLRGIYDADGNRVFLVSDNDSGTGRNSQVLFKALESATYYVSAGGNKTSRGSYTLSVADVTESVQGDYGPGGIRSEALSVGGSASGEIEYAGEVDWYRVDLEAGSVYQIDLKGSPTGDGTLPDPFFRGIYEADGSRIYHTKDNDSGTGHNSRVLFTAPEASTYYLAAGGRETSRGSYTLSVTDVTESVMDDYGSVTTRSGRLLVGGLASGDIEHPGDTDWYAVELEAGKFYRFVLKGANTGGGTLTHPYLVGIHDAEGTLIGGTRDLDAGGRDNSRVFFAAATTATYYVAAGGYGEHQGTYTLSADESEDYGSHTADGVRLTVPVGGTVAGTLDKVGDRDWFTTDLEAGKVYRIDLKGWSSGSDLYVQIYDERLRPVYNLQQTVEGSGSGRYAQTIFIPEATAEYTLGAGGYGDWTGVYTLSVTADYASDTGTSGTVAVGGEPTSEVVELPGDHDWFAVVLETGKGYLIDLKGSETGDGTLADPYLRGIYDAAGVLIDGTSDNNSGEGNNSRIYFTATADATYYVSAAGNGSSTGRYTLSVMEQADDYPSDIGTSGTVTVGDEATGEVEYPGDRDWFAVELVAGDTYRIDLKGASTIDGGSLRDPYLHGIYDADSELIDGTSDNDSGAGKNSQLYFTAETSGTHYVAATAKGDGTGTYVLTVSDGGDDFSADEDTTGVVGPGSTAVGRIENPGDVDWFAVDLVAGQSYRLHLNGADFDDGTLVNPNLIGVYDSDANLISGTSDRSHGTGRNSFVRNFTPSESGTYYVAAGGIDFNGQSTGTYTLFVFEYAEASTPPTATTTAIELGSSANGNITKVGERQWFTVDLMEGNTYRFDVKGSDTDDGTLRNPEIRIYDPRLAFMGLLDRDSGVGRNSRVAFTPAESGTFYVSVGHIEYGRSTPRLGTYEVSVTYHSGNDFQASLVLVDTIAVDGSATGDIRFWNDVQWFEVALEAGHGYRVDVMGSDTGDGTQRDPYLAGIYDSSGRWIAGSTDYDSGVGLNARAGFIASEAGPYYVKVGGNGGVGTYKVAVSEFVDLAASTDTAGEVTVGGSVDGMVDFRGDHDWFEVQLVADQIYRITLAARSTGRGTLIQPDLIGVRNSSGELIDGTADDDRRADTYNSLVFFTPTADGTYYVVAGAKSWAVSGSQNHVGGYRLSVTAVSTAERPDDFSASTDTAGSVPVNGSTTGTIDYSGDRDWFAVDLEPGTYQIDMEGRWNFSGTLPDPYLYGIHDAEGNLIPGTTDDNGGFTLHSRVQFTATQAARYYIAAGADNDVFETDQGTYTLSVEEVI